MVNNASLRIKFLHLFCLLSLATFVSSAQVNPVYLRTEYEINPVTDNSKPRLSWELQSIQRAQKQTAYQILVASSVVLLANNDGDLWNSKKVNSAQTNQIEYGGKALKATQVCYWKIRSWDKNGTVGKWSNTSKWEIGLLTKTNWKASWIGNDLTNLGKGKVYHLPPAPFFRKEVVLNGIIKKARLYVSALGLFNFYINGK